MNFAGRSEPSRDGSRGICIPLASSTTDLSATVCHPASVARDGSRRGSFSPDSSSAGCAAEEPGRIDARGVDPAITGEFSEERALELKAKVISDLRCDASADRRLGGRLVRQ